MGSPYIITTELLSLNVFDFPQPLKVFVFLTLHSIIINTKMVKTNLVNIPQCWNFLQL